jgi:MFS family permease
VSATELSGNAVAPSATTGARRLSRRASLWAVALSFFVVSAFSTAPSSLYGLYEKREILTSFEVTVVYAVYAAGLIASLVLAGHVSDWYGRRTVLIPGVVIAMIAAAVLIVWMSLPGLLLARVLTGAAVGVTVATATAFINDLDGGGVPSRRATIVATIANIGGLGAGPLVAGLLALDASRRTR